MKTSAVCITVSLALVVVAMAIVVPWAVASLMTYGTLLANGPWLLASLLLIGAVLVALLGVVAADRGE